MDRPDLILDNQNHFTFPEAALPAVPNFSLYGERETALLGDWLHCESIPARSLLYDWEIRPHRHHHLFQILYLNGGSGECVLEGRRMPLLPTTAVTVTPGVVHGFRFSEDVQGWVLTMMSDRTASALDAIQQQDAFAAPRLIPLGEGEAARAVGGCLEMIVAELVERRAGRDALIQAQLASVFVLLGRHLAGAQPGLASGSLLGQRAEQFRVLLGRHFREERSLDFYAARLGVSVTHLNRICRAVMGRSALGVIHDRILTEASRDLAFTNMSVNEVAHSLGFDDPAYFSRFFAKGAGVSPSGYRRKVARTMASA